MFKLPSLSFLLLLLLLLSMVDAQQCRWQYNLQTNQPINITSSNFPRALPAGSSCRYLIKAPPNHVIHLTCRFEVVIKIWVAYQAGSSFDSILVLVSRHLSGQVSLHLTRR